MHFLIIPDKAGPTAEIQVVSAGTCQVKPKIQVLIMTMTLVIVRVTLTHQ